MTTDQPQLLGRLAVFFSLEEWPYEPVEGQTILHLVYRDDHAEFDCYAQSIEEDDQILFYSLAPFRVPEERMVETVELITRANFGLPIGNFEIDIDDGDLRFKTSVDVPVEQISNELIASIVGANLSVMNHYLPGIRAVAFAGSDPHAVISELEG